MKNWPHILNISDLVPKWGSDESITAEQLLKIRDRALEQLPDIFREAEQFRDTYPEYYDKGHLESASDRENFMEDLYDWADDNDVWVETFK